MLQEIESYLADINPLFAVFVVAMLPIVELRGAIPFGVSLGLNYYEVYLVSVLGNVLPVPFVILFFRPIINYLEKTKLFGSLAAKVKQRTKKKAKKMNDKYKLLGLFLFVAIPIPGTGAWTGSAIAAMMKMRIKHALIAIFVGVFASGIIMTLISAIVEWCARLF